MCDVAQRVLVTVDIRRRLGIAMNRTEQSPLNNVVWDGYSPAIPLVLAVLGQALELSRGSFFDVSVTHRDLFCLQTSNSPSSY